MTEIGQVSVRQIKMETFTIQLQPTQLKRFPYRCKTKTVPASQIYPQEKSARQGFANSTKIRKNVLMLRVSLKSRRQLPAR